MQEWNKRTDAEHENNLKQVEAYNTDTVPYRTY
jgi:hypothetical protein